MSWRAGLFALLLVALIGARYVYLPYVGWSDSRTGAKARVEAYLAAVVGGNVARGLSLLEASGRRKYGSEGAYRRLMADADWSRFEWELHYNGLCDDGICSFLLRLPNGPGSAPEAA